MSEPARRRPQPKTRAAATGRSTQPAARHERSRRRPIGWGATLAVLVTVVAIIAVTASGAGNNHATVSSLRGQATLALSRRPPATGKDDQ